MDKSFIFFDIIYCCLFLVPWSNRPQLTLHLPCPISSLSLSNIFLYTLIIARLYLFDFFPGVVLHWMRGFHSIWLLPPKLVSFALLQSEALLWTFGASFCFFKNFFFFSLFFCFSFGYKDLPIFFGFFSSSTTLLMRRFSRWIGQLALKWSGLSKTQHFLII